MKTKLVMVNRPYFLNNLFILSLIALPFGACIESEVNCADSNEDEVLYSVLKNIGIDDSFAKNIPELDEPIWIRTRFLDYYIASTQNLMDSSIIPICSILRKHYNVISLKSLDELDGNNNGVVNIDYYRVSQLLTLEGGQHAIEVHYIGSPGFDQCIYFKIADSVPHLDSIVVCRQD